MWLEGEDVRYRALITSLSVDVEGSIEGPYVYQPSALSGLLFATSTPPDAAPKQRTDPPRMHLGEGQLGYGVEGRATALDVSDTPLYLGDINGFDGNLRLSAQLEASTQGLVITLRDAAGTQADIDFTLGSPVRQAVRQGPTGSVVFLILQSTLFLVRGGTAWSSKRQLSTRQMARQNASICCQQGCSPNAHDAPVILTGTARQRRAPFPPFRPHFRSPKSCRWWPAVRP